MLSKTSLQYVGERCALLIVCTLMLGLLKGACRCCESPISFQLNSLTIKAGVHLKAVFWLGVMFLMQISCLRFKQSRISSLITHIYVWRRFVDFLVIFRFIWR